jgi:hypothetical protein
MKFLAGDALQWRVEGRGDRLRQSPLVPYHYAPSDRRFHEGFSHCQGFSAAIRKVQRAWTFCVRRRTIVAVDEPVASELPPRRAEVSAFSFPNRESISLRYRHATA